MLVEFIVLLLAVAVCGHGWYGTTSLPLPPHLQLGGNYQFLTNLALLLTLIYLVVATIVDLDRRNRRLMYYYHMTMFNINFLVTSTYWILYFQFPHFLNVGAFEVSKLVDLEIHLFPYLFLLLDHFRVRKYARGTPWTLVSTIAVLSVYWLRIEWVVASSSGMASFPYPFLRDITFVSRLQWLVLFMVVACTNQLVFRH